MTIYRREFAKFEREVLSVAVQHEQPPVTEVDDSHLQSANLGIAGRPRSTLRAVLKQLTHTADIQLIPQWQVKLQVAFADSLLNAGEHTLAVECLERVLVRERDAPDTQIRVTTMYKIVESKHILLVGSSKYSRIAPIAVSQVLVLLQDLRMALETIFESMPTKEQEAHAWLVLNGCKLLLKIAQPLVWLSCGKYVSESLVFAGVCMESVINLCTARHLKFRMKLYVSAYYATLVQGSSDESRKLLAHAEKQVRELREREELDPPVPDKVQSAILVAEVDLAVMRMLQVFWNDSDAIDVSDEAALRAKYTSPAGASLSSRTFADRCLSECVRVQQLTCGNANEPWRKRSSSILRAAWKLLSAVAVPAPADEETGLYDAAVVATAVPLSLECLVEVATIAIFDQTEGTPVSDLLSKVWALGRVLETVGQQAQQQAPSEEEKQGSIIAAPGTAGQELLLLEQLMAVLTSSSTAAAEDGQYSRLAACLKFSSSLSGMMFSSQVRRRQALLRRAAVGVWGRFLYPALQQVLSEDQSPRTLPALIDAAPALMAAVRVLDITGLEDPILVASASMLCGAVFKHLGDFRAAVALLRQALDSLEEHRAARVDLGLHMPADVRDVLALQRASLSARAEAADWFHSIKRLGAHAFAGFGIFGAGSSADRTDQALAELHTDMLALYFRCELEHAIKQRQARSGYKGALRALNEAKGRPAPTRAGDDSSSVAAASIVEDENDAAKLDPSLRLAESFAKTILASASVVHFSGVSTDSLPCVSSLKSFCGKNSYAKCLLLLEMARVEESEDARLELLMAAQSSVEEAEAKEEVLSQAFADLSVVTVQSKGAPARPPIVLARSHKFIYVSPVTTRRALEGGKVQYFKVFAKELGSGTSVSLANDDLPGCEKQIPLQDLHSPVTAATKVSRLRSGERYVFAYAAFGEDGAPLAPGISPSSVAVDAVNPLPTILLWAYCSRVAFEVCGSSSSARGVGRLAASMVCRRFFLTVPKPEQPLSSVGKGTNLFVEEDPAICMLAVQQSSQLLLSNFVAAFLALETVPEALATPPGLSAVHFDLRAAEQSRRLVALKRTALAAVAAVHSMSPELVVRCVLLGYQLAAELLLFDEVHLAHVLQGPLLVLVVALQTVPKESWHDLEHRLYARLLQHSVKLAVLNRNVAAIVPVLSALYPEAAHVPLSTPVAEQQYRALRWAVQRVGGGIVAKAATTVDEHLKALLSTPTPSPRPAEADPESVGEIWQLSELRRQFLVEQSSLALLNADASAAGLAALLREAPTSASDLLAAVAVLAKEAVAAGQLQLVPKALALIPAFDKLFCPAAREADALWQLKVLRDTPEGGLGAAMAAAAAAAAASAAPAGKGAPAPAKGGPAAAPVVAAPEEGEAERPAVPPRFTETSAEEEKRQLLQLAELAALLAATFDPAVAERRVHFPLPGSLGPEATLNPYHAASSLPHDAPSSPPDASTNADPAAAAASAAVTAEEPSPEVQYVRLLCAGISLYADSDSPAAAVRSCVALWNFLVDRFMSPRELALLLPLEQRRCLVAAASSLVRMFETLTAVDPLITSVAESGSATADAAAAASATAVTSQVIVAASDVPAVPPRLVKEHLLAARSCVVFLVKALWLYHQHLDVVDLGTRALHVYLTTAPELVKVMGEATMPLLTHSQEQLVDAAEQVLAEKKAVVEACEAAFAEYLKKKRRKKTRVVKLEKDDDELAHDTEVAVLQAAVDDAQEKLGAAQGRMRALQLQQKRFDTLSSTGVQLLDKVRKQALQLLEDCATEKCGGGQAFAEAGADGAIDYASLLSGPGASPALVERLDATLDQFAQVASFLREKRDRLTLIEALKEQGDLLLVFGKVQEARGVWHDGIDGYFNAMDACTHWQEVTRKALEALDGSTVLGMLPAVVILGKLSRYCVPGDRDMKASYCRMAAELCKAPFRESRGHPLSDAGFAAYVCADLAGLAPLSASPNKLPHAALCLSLGEVLRVLCAERCHFEALPVVCLLEHLYGYYSCSAEKWLSARLMRVRLLVDSHLYAQAASSLASLRSSVVTIMRRSHGAPLLAAQLAALALDDFDARETGLDFFDKSSAPFFNHLPPSAPENVKAAAWIAALPAEFSKFVEPFRAELPDLRSEEQKAADAAAADAAAAAAAEAAAKAKKGKAEPVPEPVANAALTVPLFPALLLTELSVVCAQLLVELSLADGKRTAAHAQQLAAFGTQGLELVAGTQVALAQAQAQAVSMGGVGVLNSALWVSLYGRCVVLQARVNVSRRKYRAARAAAVAALQVLAGASSSVGAALQAEAKFERTDLWLQLRDLLVDLADRQARFQQAIASATVLATDAAAVMSGTWLRCALLRRASVHFKLGDTAAALVDVEAALRHYRSSGVRDAGLVRILTLKATCLREQHLVSPPQKAVSCLSDGVALLRQALGVAEVLAARAGFLGADVNVTFSSSDSESDSLVQVLRHHAVAPALHSLTDLYDNEPALSLKAKVSERRLAEIRSNGAAVGRLSAGSVADREEDEEVIEFRESRRPGPVDASETVMCRSVYANAHLHETRTLVSLQAALLAFLDDVRCSAASTTFDPREREPPASSSSREDDWSDLGAPLPAVLAPALALREQASRGEDCLKALRHVVFAPPLVRVWALLSVGKTRYAAVKAAGTSLFSLSLSLTFPFSLSYSSSLLLSIHTNTAAASTSASARVDGEWFLAPLQAALVVAQQPGGAHPWSLMRDVCVQLAECHADRAVDWGADPAVRMQMALQYLQSAIRLSGQLRSITHDVVGLTQDKGFSAPVPEDLATLLAAATSSSATLPAAPPPAPVDPKAKAPAKGAAVAAVSQGPDGRDALFLLSAMLREGRGQWPDAPQWDDQADLHQLLKGYVPAYASRCTLATLPSPTAQAQVPAGSVSALFCPARLPDGFPDDVVQDQHLGLFSHVAAYFILGAKDPARGPELTKIVLLRRDVVATEKALRDLRDAAAAHKAAGADLVGDAAALSDILFRLCQLLAQGFIDTETRAEARAQAQAALTEKERERDATPRVCVDEAALSARLVFPAASPEPLAVPLDDALLLGLADLLSCDKDTDALSNPTLCAFFRGALGYRD